MLVDWLNSRKLRRSDSVAVTDSGTPCSVAVARIIDRMSGTSDMSRLMSGLLFRVTFDITYLPL